MQITKQIVFDAAHHLPHYDGKCRNMHGHTWTVEVTLEGKIGKDGMVFDFCKLNEMLRERVYEKFDHHCLNDFIANPTAENIALWCWHELRELPLARIRIGETGTSFATMTAEDYEGKGPELAR